MINALTVDVEDYFHVQAFAHKVNPRDWHAFEYRATANTERLLEMFETRGLRATFFVLGWVAEKAPELVRRIAGAGHEVACHGLDHQLVYNQTPEVFRRDTMRSKRLLEDITGQAVLGYRAATYSITRRSLWALDILAELGFAYDSSIFPVRHDFYGIPDAEPGPGVITSPAGHRLVEFPLSVASVFGARVPVSGGGYFRILPLWFTLYGLRSVNRKDRRPFVFYLHPWEIDPGQPSIGAGWKSRLRHYTNLHRTSARLARLLDEFRFSTMADVLAVNGLLPARAAA